MVHPETPGRLSVKEVADVAGVTPRTVRHYHSIGLLPEPPRDSSGYRRYGGIEVIELVRIVRLRALGLPLPQIAQRLQDDGAGDTSVTEALDAFADELDAEIRRLQDSRDRVRELARSESFDQPAEVLTRALQTQGVLGPADQLRGGESWAAALLDALHPQGMPGVLAEADRLLADSSVTARIRPLRRRLGKLSERSSEAKITALAADVVAVLAPGARDRRVDVDLVDLMLTDRLNPTQRRFVRELRTQLQGSGQ